MTDPINHATREPHQPTTATIVEGNVAKDGVDDYIEYKVGLARKGPGDVEFTLTINGRSCGQLPFDNLVKAATRIDPDHAIGPEKQIQKLRREVSVAQAEKFDWQTKAEQLEQRLKQYEAAEAVPS